MLCLVRPRSLRSAYQLIPKPLQRGRTVTGTYMVAPQRPVPLYPGDYRVLIGELALERVLYRTPDRLSILQLFLYCWSIAVPSFLFVLRLQRNSERASERVALPWDSLFGICAK